MTFITQDVARSVVVSIGDDSRAAIINRARAMRTEIAQIFADAEHWNRVSVPWKGGPIDPDPDGKLKQIAASLDKMLAAEDKRPNAELSGPRPLAAEGSDSNDVLGAVRPRKD